MTMIPAALGAIASKTFAEKLITRLGYRRMLATNTVLLGTLIAGFALVQPGAPHAWLIVHLGIFGIVNSLQFTAMNTLALGALDESSASGGNSLLSVVAQVAMGMGVAAAGALLSVFGGGAPVQGSPEVLRTFHTTYACVGALSALAAIVFLQLRPHEGRMGKDGAPGDDTS
jgi:fucose permease